MGVDIVIDKNDAGLAARALSLNINNKAATAARNCLESDYVRNAVSKSAKELKSLHFGGLITLRRIFKALSDVVQRFMLTEKNIFFNKTREENEQQVVHALENADIIDARLFAHDGPTEEITTNATAGSLRAFYDFVLPGGEEGGNLAIIFYLKEPQAHYSKGSIQDIDFKNIERAHVVVCHDHSQEPFTTSSNSMWNAWQDTNVEHASPFQNDFDIKLTEKWFDFLKEIMSRRHEKLRRNKVDEFIVHNDSAFTRGDVYTVDPVFLDENAKDLRKH